MNDYYAIDSKIISILLGIPEDDERVSAFWAQYLFKIQELRVKFTADHLKSKGKTEIEIENIFNEMDEKGISSELVGDLEYTEKLGDKVNNYNELVYKTFEPKLGENQKNTLDKYIAEVRQNLTSELEEFSKEVKQVVEDGKLEIENIENQIKKSEQKEQVSPVEQNSQVQTENQISHASEQSPPDTPQLPNVSLAEKPGSE